MPNGGVKHTPWEPGLCHAGKMESRHSVSLSRKMISTYGQNYLYVLQILYFMYSEYYTGQIKSPTTVSIDKKPPQINLYRSIRHSQGSEDRGRPSQPQMMPMGFPPGPPGMGANFYPSTFMNPWVVQYAMMGQGSVPIGVNDGIIGMSCHLSLAASHNYSGIGSQASALLPPPVPAANIDYPEVDDWVMYCDKLAKRSRAKLGLLRERFQEQGFFQIDQLTGDWISHCDLSQSLGIGMGIVALIVRYAEEDVKHVREGTFNMDTA